MITQRLKCVYVHVYKNSDKMKGGGGGGGGQQEGKIKNETRAKHKKS